LPLFPLNTVLFPNASLPLQIFEERYKLMLRECMESDNRFGVSLIREGPEVGGPAVPHEIGTVAHITQVNRIDGDRFFVSAVGVQRFRVLNVTQREPFVAAEVELIDDSSASSESSDELVREVTDAFSNYAQASVGVSGGWVSRTRVPSHPEALSYHIANSVQIDVGGKQRLLEHETTASRLTAELELLKKAYSRLRRQMTLEMMNRFSRQ
jgi:Lon protease-like protein